MAASDHQQQQQLQPRKSTAITPEELHKERSKAFKYFLKLCNNRGNSQKPPLVVGALLPLRPALKPIISSEELQPYFDERQPATVSPEECTVLLNRCLLSIDEPSNSN